MDGTRIVNRHTNPQKRIRARRPNGIDLIDNCVGIEAVGVEINDLDAVVLTEMGSDIRQVFAKRGFTASDRQVIDFA